MFYQLVFFICFAQWMCISEGLLFKPRKKCVPTATVEAPCYRCVCSTDGVYHCVHKKCNNNETETTPYEKECEPLFSYVEKSMICSCSPSGNWRSWNCRQRFRTIQTKTTLTNQVLRTNIACKPDMLYLMDCNICRCEPNGIIKPASCTNRPCSAIHKADICHHGDIERFGNELCACSDINYFIDRLCFHVNNDTMQTVETKNLEKLVYADNSWRRTFKDNYKCNNSVNFTIDCNNCTCTNNRLKCTNNLCFIPNNKLRSNEVIKSNILPQLKSSNEGCVPGRKYRFRCNFCVCADDGLPTCTTMICLEAVPLDVPGLRAVLKTPDAKPNLSNIARNIPDIHDVEKCHPGKTYKVDCNTCYCKNDGNMMCTKLFCLTPKETKTTKKRDSRKKFQDTKNETASFAKIPKQSMREKTKKLFQLTEVPKNGCVPGKIYRKGCQTCFCNEKKEASCTNKKDACKNYKRGFRFLEDIRPPFLPGEVDSLPELPQRQVQCSPGKAYKVDCNGCVCTAGRNLICDQFICLSYDDMHRIEADEKSKAPCNPKEYKKTEADCVTCECVKNKLKCSEVVGCISENDKRLPNWNNGKPKLTLDMYTETCIPGGVYRMDCNNCYCQDDKTLRCTQKTCLNYSQSKALEKQRLFLIQNGL